MNFFNWRCVYVVWPLEYLIKKPPVPTKRATVSLITYVLACIRIYLKSVLRHKYLILDTYYPDICIYVRKDVRISGYFSKPKGVREQKSLGNTGLGLFNDAVSSSDDIASCNVFMIEKWFGVDLEGSGVALFGDVAAFN
jgi:hypothetical protein